MNHITAIALILVMATQQPQTRADEVATSPTSDLQSGFRVATFNISFNRPKQGQLAADLMGTSQQAIKVARIIRTIQPDIVLLNEFDYDQHQRSLKLFQQKYLEAKLPVASADQASLPAAVYPFSYINTVNTGEPSGLDIDKNGKPGGPGDAFGFGQFPGQYGMVVLSKYPILTEQARTFQNLLWASMPNAAAPLADDGQPWYPAAIWNGLRLSSKSHWDVPVKVGDRVVHILASHPTPPAFDGPEDRNGKRNHDEIKLWAEYLTNQNTDWLVDDSGKAGGLPETQAFVIVGDLNADPADGGSHQQAIMQLLRHPRINCSFRPRSDGAVQASATQKKVNLKHRGQPDFDTADFSDGAVGNLRADYVLPSTQFVVKSGGVFWPTAGEPLADDIDCTDHRLVWLDLTWN